MVASRNAILVYFHLKVLCSNTYLSAMKNYLASNCNCHVGGDGTKISNILTSNFITVLYNSEEY
jgi:hypothetical protein